MRRKAGAALALFLTGALAAACTVEDPSITSTNIVPAVTAAPLPTPLPPQALPTPAPPVLATPTPAIPVTPVPPTAVPPTPEPAATEAPAPAATPIPARTPVPDIEPVPVPAGPVSVEVGGVTSFALSQTRPILALPGHALIYVDPDREAEVDIFTPIADANQMPLASLDDVVQVLMTDPAFSQLTPLSATTVAGFTTRVFEGPITSDQVGFYADPSTFANPSAGWYPPVFVRLWVIDAPGGVVVVSAETLVNPGQYAEAIGLATEILATITFSP